MPRRIHKPCSHRILKNVLNYAADVIAITKNAFIVTGLPESPGDPSARDVRTSLLRGGDKAPQVRPWHCPSCHQVNVIGHEAVREKFEVVRAGALRKLQQNVADDSGSREATSPRESAERQRITETTAVRKSGKTSRAHATFDANGGPPNARFVIGGVRHRYAMRPSMFVGRPFTGRQIVWRVMRCLRGELDFRGRRE
jgi:hypothetical protein